jgi:uncharacterized protein (TIGR02145 family)/uncharacterized repeat protein (TIGR02543 family)
MISSHPTSQTVLMGGTFTLSVTANSVPAPTGYTWYRDGTPISGATGSSYTITSAAAIDRGVYHAVVSNGEEEVRSDNATIPLRCTITFNSNQGSAVSSQTVNYGAYATEPTPPTRSGYQFGGWFTTSGLNTEFQFADVQITNHRTLYAKWNLITYTITYNLNNGTGNSSNPENYTVESITITLSAPTRTGYTFGGWYDAATGGNLVNSIPQGSTGNKAFWARWSPIIYTITYNVNDGVSKAPTNHTIETASFNLTPTTKRSYVFDGWYSNENLTGSAVASIPTGSTGNRTLYAKWVIKDIDGNIYTEVQIGNQVWMVENLRVKKFKNGIPIARVNNATDWLSRTTPAYCWYDNDSLTYKQTYGAMYNGFTFAGGNLAPEGWRVPNGADINELVDFCGGFDVAGMHLKEQGFVHWDDRNVNATNSTGFTALPGGLRSRSDGLFYGIGYGGNWWVDHPGDEENPWMFYLLSPEDNLVYFWGGNYRHDGLSVRCIRE